MQWPVSPIDQPRRDLAVVWGPRKALCPSGRGGGMHLQAAHSPASSGAEASWEPWPGTGLLESARDLLPCQWLPGKGDSD